MRTRPVHACSRAPADVVDQDAYRNLSDLITAGLAVLTTRQGPHDLAVTVDSYLDVSYDPPTMLVCLYGMSRATGTPSFPVRSRISRSGSSKPPTPPPTAC